MSLNTKGRPCNFSTEEIKQIIERHILYTEGKSLFTASDVAKFARTELGLAKFKYYVITRNEEASRYLDEMNSEIKNSVLFDGGDSNVTFKTLDIAAYLRMTPDDLEKALRNLNAMFETMSDRQAKIIKDNLRLNKENAEIKNANQILEKEKEHLATKHKETIQAQENKIKEMKESLSVLEKVLKSGWDIEAETLLKKQGIFEDDNSIVDESKNIVSLDYDFTEMITASLVTTNEGREENIREAFLKGLEDI